MHDFLRESTKATGIALLSGLSISIGGRRGGEKTATFHPEVEDYRVKSVIENEFPVNSIGNSIETKGIG